MAYNKTEWNNGGTPAMSAKNLNNIEEGIYFNNTNLIGFISFYCAKEPPSGWLICDGRDINRETYSLLYERIGESFGSGDGSTTFNLPDLRGEFIRGFDNGKGTDKNRVFGSRQEGSIFNPNNSIKDLAANYEELYNIDYENGCTYGGVNKIASSRPYGYRTRPNNIALLPCIYTGVYDK